MEKTPTTQQETKGGRKLEVSEKFKENLEQAGWYIEGFAEGIRKKEPELTEFLKNFIDSIDFAVLNQLFDTYLRRSDVDIKEKNIILKDRFVISSSKDKYCAMYIPLLNYVAFNLDSNLIQNIKKTVIRNEKVSDEVITKLRLITFHELVHGTGHIRIQATSKEAESNKIKKIGADSVLCGYASASRDGTKYWEALNEGVVERIAEEWLVEYARRIGENKRIVEGVLQSADTFNRYSIYNGFIEIITQRIDIHTHLESGTAWNAFVAGHFSGTSFDDTLIKELFNDAFSSDFLEQYKKIGNDTSMEKLGHFSAEHNMKFDKGIKQRWVEFLYNKKG